MLHTVLYPRRTEMDLKKKKKTHSGLAEETVMLERARERKGRQGGFSRTQLDDISLSAHRAIYLLTAYCTTITSEQYNYVCK